VIVGKKKMVVKRKYLKINFKKILKSFFYILLIVSNFILIYRYQQVVPVKIFILFNSLLVVFILGEFVIYKTVKIKFKYNIYFLKIWNLFYFIVLSFLVYLFAIYIYPGISGE